MSRPTFSRHHDELDSARHLQRDLQPSGTGRWRFGRRLSLAASQPDRIALMSFCFGGGTSIATRCAASGHRVRRSASRFCHGYGSDSSRRRAWPGRCALPGADVEESFERQLAARLCPPDRAGLRRAQQAGRRAPLVQHLLYRISALENTPTQKRDREMWVYAGPVQCLDLLASELELMGALNRWNCEQMLRPYDFGQPPATSAWIEKFWRKAISGAGSSQICRQLKMNPLNLSANVSALRNAANSCAATGAVKWTLQMDTILSISCALCRAFLASIG